MHFLKAILYTLLYIVFHELIGTWVLVADYFEVDFLIEYSSFLSRLLRAVAVMMFIFYVNNRSFKLPQSTSYKWYIFSIVVGCLFVFIQTPLNWLYNFISGEDYRIIYEFQGLKNFLNITVLSVVILAPIAEELFFREFLQKNLQKHTRPITAVLVISILFASLHLPYMNLFSGMAEFSFHHAYIVFFGSLFLGFVYYKSRSIGPPIVLHMLWNFMVFLV